jgi:hypothetical protein
MKKSTPLFKHLICEALAGLAVLMLSILTVTILNPDSVAAQDDGWSLYFLNPDTYELTQVNSDATTQTYDLGPQADAMFERQFAVSADGSLAAYCIMEMVEIHTDDEVPFMTLIIYDMKTQQNRFEIDLGESDGCLIRASAFSEDAGLLGVGLISPRYDATEWTWRVPIIDTENGDILHDIRSDDTLVMENRDLFHEIAYFMPEIHELSENEVVFRQLSWRTEGGYSMEAVRWNWEDDTLTAEPNLNNGIWIEVTGELIWVERDDSLPLADPQAPIAQRNVVRVRRDNGDEATLFFSGNQVVQQVMLINGGRELLIRTYVGYDADNPRQQESHMIVLDRSGNLRELDFEGEGFVRILNAPNGYITIANTADDVVSIIAHENGEAQVLWETDDTFRMVVGQSPIPMAEGLEPFVALE